MTTNSNPPSRPDRPAILVAEDNPDVRAFIVRALQSDAYFVTDVADGQEALDALSRRPYDALVADIVMPNLDGIALALKAVRVVPDIKIVLVSGYAQERMRAHNLDAAVHRIMAKPFSLDEIREAVRDALKG